MIVTCDSCNTRYLVADTLLGDDGRRVRCTVCQHEWYQDLVTEDLKDKEAEISFQDLVEEASIEADEQVNFGPEQENHDDDDLKLAEDIPEAVVPLPDEYSPALVDSDSTPLRVRLFSYLCSLCMGGLILLLLVIFKSSVISHWWPMMGFYQKIGIESVLPGEGLQFSEVKAITGPNKEGVNILYIEGNIINFKNEDVQLPTLKASLIDSEGKIIDSWVVKLSDTKVSKLGAMPFSTTYPEVSKDIKEASLRFELSS